MRINRYICLILGILLLLSAVSLAAKQKAPAAFKDLTTENVSKETLWEKFVRVNKEIQQRVATQFKKVRSDFLLSQNCLLLVKSGIVTPSLIDGKRYFALSTMDAKQLSANIAFFLSRVYVEKIDKKVYRITVKGRQYVLRSADQNPLSMKQPSLLLGLLRYGDLIVAEKQGAWRLHNGMFQREITLLMNDKTLVSLGGGLTGATGYKITAKGNAELKSWANDSKLWAILLILLFSVAYGFVHSSGPGHGKVLVASYLLDHGKHMRDAVKMAFFVSLSHTGSAFLLATFFQILISSTPDPAARQSINAAFSIGSGILIILIGGYDFITKIFSKKESEHAPVKEQRSLTFIAIAAGIIPCPLSMFVMALAVSMGLYPLGVLSLAGMSLGMFLLLFLVGLLVIKSRSGIEGRFAATSRFRKLFQRSIGIVSSLVVILFGIIVMAGGF